MPRANHQAHFSYCSRTDTAHSCINSNSQPPIASSPRRYRRQNLLHFDHGPDWWPDVERHMGTGSGEAVAGAISLDSSCKG
jgi:hypothetical protein